jgi:hypothetical protein
MAAQREISGQTKKVIEIKTLSKIIKVKIFRKIFRFSSGSF